MDATPGKECPLIGKISELHCDKPADISSVFQSDLKQEKEDVLPPVGREVLVQCQGFRCLAYRDVAGKWRSYFDKKELPEVLEIVE